MPRGVPKNGARKPRQTQQVDKKLADLTGSITSARNLWRYHQEHNPGDEAQLTRLQKIYDLLVEEREQHKQEHFLNTSKYFLRPIKTSKDL